MMVLDSHVHCGLTEPYERIAALWRDGGIDGGAAFSPVEEIYDRYDPSFTDSEEYVQSRARVHGYLLELAEREQVFPYFFVWNDFLSVPEAFRGIKWHRHANEPVYRYETPECDRIIEEICKRKLPIVLEEEFSHTLEFIQEIAERTVVIIPHMGALNGGYYRLKKAGIFESPMVWVDTALAGTHEIDDFAQTFGSDRIMFGSDYPFGLPQREKQKLLNIFSGEELSAVLSGNLLRLMGDT
jgi:predicted TIM-barrel fold metal-dependent hydrolase